MMVADTFNSRVEPVRTQINSMQRIPISLFCSLGESKSKWIIKDENLSQVCST